MGAIDEAEKSLAKIDREALGNGPLAVDVWSLAGRIAKERFAAARDRSGSAARQYAARAIENYSHAHAISGDAYPAVNAATMAMLAGDTALAQRLAQQALLPRRGRRMITGTTPPRARRCSSSAASTRPASAMPKRIGWRANGTATSRPCAASCC